MGLLEKHGVEALFAGHVHNFWFHRHGATDCYLLPSTAFVRLDYSEMQRVAPEPGSEFGRDDRPKLGYAVVHVHEGGHLLEIVRTWGATAEAGSPEPVARRRVEPVHPRLNRRDGFGFDMRQNWMETVEIPPTGGLDEFDRKTARNDYPLMALWEMGVRRVRIPSRDLALPERARRLRDLRDHGHLFTLFTFGAPKARLRDLVARHGDLLASWEICLNVESLERDIADVGEAARSAGPPVHLSRLRSIAERRAEAGKYHHAIDQGFLADARDEMAALLARAELAGALAGFVFRATADRAPWEAVAEASAAAAGLGVAASVHLRMTGADPARETADDHGAAARVAEAVAAAAAFPNAVVFADTFIDFDRGYFPRRGALDRRFNPRPRLPRRALAQRRARRGRRRAVARARGRLPRRPLRRTAVGGRRARARPAGRRRGGDRCSVRRRPRLARRPDDRRDRPGRPGRRPRDPPRRADGRRRRSDPGPARGAAPAGRPRS